MQRALTATTASRCLERPRSGAPDGSLASHGVGAVIDLGGPPMQGCVRLRFDIMPRARSTGPHRTFRDAGRVILTRSAGVRSVRPRRRGEREFLLWTTIAIRSATRGRKRTTRQTLRPHPPVERTAGHPAPGRAAADGGPPPPRRTRPRPRALPPVRLPPGAMRGRPAATGPAAIAPSLHSAWGRTPLPHRMPPATRRATAPSAPPAPALAAAVVAGVEAARGR